MSAVVEEGKGFRAWLNKRLPVDEFVATGPGHWIGTGVGLAVGAPFHLVALPFGAAGPPPDPPPSAEEPGRAEEEGRPGEAPPAGGPR